MINRSDSDTKPEPRRPDLEQDNSRLAARAGAEPALDAFSRSAGCRTDASLRSAHDAFLLVLPTGIGPRSTPCRAAATTQAILMHNIIDTAVATGNFKTLATALTATGLASRPRRLTAPSQRLARRAA